MATNIGLNIIEVDGSGAPAIVGAATSVVAFNIATRRGIPNSPTRITNFTQFVEQFGGYFAGGVGTYLVKGFFDNGGQTTYINRVINPDPATGHAPARLTLDDTTGTDTLTLEGGFRGQADPGAWAEELFVRVTAAAAAPVRLRETARASVAGTDIPVPVNMSALPTLTVRIDAGATPTEITFMMTDFANPAQASLAEIRDAINARTTRLVASIEGSHLVLTSSGQVASENNRFSSLQVTAANLTLGFANMANPVSGTAVALGANGTQVGNSEGLNQGDAVLIADASDSATPPTRRAFVKLTRVVPETGEVEWTPAVATPDAYQRLSTTITPQRFDLTIAMGGTTDAQIVENWPGLSLEPDLANYVPRVLNDPIRGSRYVIATDEGSASAPGADVPAALAYTRLAQGRDGAPRAADFIGNPATRTGFYAFNPFDIQLLCCERTDQDVVIEALTYCARREDCLFIGSVPEGYVGAGQAVAYGGLFRRPKAYGALYGPWIKVFDPAGAGANPARWIPPVGHVAGVYARVETTRGIWKAPAGDEAAVLGALDVEYRLSDAEHTDLVKNGSVNGIRVVPGAGIVVDASRTLSTDTRWLYVNVRLLFNYVKSSLRQGLRWVRQEPNRDTLWNAVKHTSVRPFLMGLWRQGAFGTGTPDQVFQVICDATNNPPDQVDQGNLKVEIYFYPSKPAETIVIIVGQMPSGATASEA